MTNQTRKMRVPVHSYDARKEHTAEKVTDLPSTPAALGKLLSGLVQEALDQLPRDGVVDEEPSVFILVGVRRDAVDLLQTRTVIPYNMSHMTDERSPTPAELLAVAGELTGKRVPRESLTRGERYPEVIELEVDVP